MKKLELLKTGIGLVVSVGVGALCKNAISATKIMPKRGLTRFCALVGAFVLSSMITDKAIEYTEEKIDGAVGGVKEMVENGELS